MLLDFFKKPQNQFNIVVVIFLLCMGCFLSSKNKKIGFVRSSELVYGYEGMKEAHVIQEEKTKQLKSNIDTLDLNLQQAIAQFNKEYSSLSESERKEKEKLLSMQQQNLQQYVKNAENSMKESDSNLTQGILNQVNTLVEKYAKEHGYDIVFGTTSSGNILYGEKVMDITEPVLQFLNANYTNLPDSIK